MTPYHSTAAQTGTQLIVYAVLAVLIIARSVRPRNIAVGRMWIGPVIFLLMTGFMVWGEQQNALTARAPAIIALSLAIGFIVGIPFGALRGAHTIVKTTKKPGVMYLGPSWVAAAIWLGAFAIRAGLRTALAGTAFAIPLGDGLIAFAMGMFVTSYVAIYRKYTELEHAAGQT
ncbi:MAG: hypothetical protein ACREMP_01275 [Candidatus Tyrphobacter sp.]